MIGVQPGHCLHSGMAVNILDVYVKIFCKLHHSAALVMSRNLPAPVECDGTRREIWPQNDLATFRLQARVG